MAYTQPGTVWNYEDDDVQTQVAKVVDAGGPLMKQAMGLGQMKANSRGLGNSTLAAKASQEAVLDKAVAIGGQNASQIYGKNSAEQQAQHTAAMESQRIAASMAELDKRISADKELAAAGDTAAMARLQVDVASRADLQKMADTAAMDRTEIDAASRLALQDRADTGAMQRLNVENTSRAAMNDANLASEWNRAVLGETTRTSISQAEIEARAKEVAINSQVQLTNSYLDAFSNTLADSDIPADARANVQQSIKDATAASMAIIQSVKPTEIIWNAPVPLPVSSTPRQGSAPSTGSQGLQVA